jgi:8-oxo-dGTP diphosphatase
VIRHFTASAVILHEDQVLLVHHRKLGLWLYPGGHIEPNEDPAQAVRREVHEEVGLDIEILAEQRFAHPAVGTVEAPYTILVEDVDDPEIGPHQHIDHVYVCLPTTTDAGRRVEYDGKYRWVPVTAVGQLDTPPELPALVQACAAHAADIDTRELTPP